MNWVRRDNADIAAIRAGMALRAKRLKLVDGDMGIAGSDGSPVVHQQQGGTDIEFIATTDDVDSADEVVLPDGIDWTPLRTYKAIYGDHNYGMASIVAKFRSVVRIARPNGWKIRATLMPLHYSDDVPRVLELARAGVLGASIGFVSQERSKPTPEEKARYPLAKFVIRKLQVFEVSLTAMPCNLACQATALYVDDSKATRVMELVRKGLLPMNYAMLAPPREEVVFLS